MVGRQIALAAAGTVAGSIAVEAIRSGGLGRALQNLANAGGQGFPGFGRLQDFPGAIDQAPGGSRRITVTNTEQSVETASSPTPESPSGGGFTAATGDGGGGGGSTTTASTGTDDTGTVVGPSGGGETTIDVSSFKIGSLEGTRAQGSGTGGFLTP